MDNNNLRTLFLCDDVNEKTVKDIIQKIEEYNFEDQIGESRQKNFQPTTITLMINSSGGFCYDGWALVGAIETSATPIVTICYGHAMSMAFAIFLAGHKRYAHRFATLMYHELSAGHYGKLTDRIQQTDELKRLQIMYDDYVLERTDVMQEKLDAIKDRKTEWYITPDEARKLKIIHEIIGGNYTDE